MPLHLSTQLKAAGWPAGGDIFICKKNHLITIDTTVAAEVVSIVRINSIDDSRLSPWQESATASHCRRHNTILSSDTMVGRGGGGWGR